MSCAHGINNPLDEDVLLCKSHRGSRVKAAAPTYPWVWAHSLVLTLVFSQKPGLVWSVKYPYYLCIEATLGHRTQPLWPLQVETSVK